MKGPEIAQIVTLGTNFLPSHFYHHRHATRLAPPLADVGGVYPTENGLMIWVPCDPAESAAIIAEPAELTALRVYARSIGCDFINLDCDGPTAVAGCNLPTWIW